jgi:hypothetical protein
MTLSLLSLGEMGVLSMIVLSLLSIILSLYYIIQRVEGFTFFLKRKRKKMKISG